MLKKVCCILSVVLVLLCTFSYNEPFSIHAESATGDSPIIGVNINIIDVDRYYQLTYAEVTLDDNADRWKCKTMASGGGACSVYESADTTGAVVDHKIEGDLSSFSYSYTSTSIYEYEFILDGSYVGYITFSSAFGTTTAKKKFVNGTSFKVTGTALVSTFSVSSYQLYKNDLGNEWMFPIESFPWCSYLINNLWDRYYGLNEYNSYTFPIFHIYPGDIIFSGNTAYNWTWDLILYVNRSVNSGQIANYITLPANASFQNWTMINRFNFNGTLGYLFKVQIVFDLPSGSSSNTFNLVWNGGQNNANLDAMLMPIYFNPVYEKSYISTDFALNFGLSNQLLDDIHALATNTPETEQSASNLDDMTDNLNDSITDFDNYEQQFTDNLDTALQDIDTNVSFSDLGSKFQNSAQWVKLQFDRMTNTTPYGSLLGFSMLIGISLLIVGRTLR